jgi:drug/metabolite transporter (DMT)-like permease
MALWATNFPVAERLLIGWHPVLLTPMRAGVAAIALIVIVIILGQWRQLFGMRVVHMAGAGGLALSVSNLFFVWGQRHVDPVTAAIIVSALPVASVAIGLVTRTERLTVMLAAGIALAVGGGFLASMGLQPGGGGAEGSVVGAVMIAVGVFCYAWHTRIIVTVSPGVSALAKAAICMTVSALMTAIVAEASLLFDMVPLEYDVSMPSLAMIAWTGAVAIGGSTALWFASGRLIGVTVAAMHHNLVPFYVMLMALALGGVVSGQTIAGAALVVLGAVLAQMPETTLWPRRQRA